MVPEATVHSRRGRSRAAARQGRPGHRSLRHRRWQLICSALATTVLVASPATGSLAAAAGVPTGSAMPAAVTSCDLPLAHDPYDGFEVGVPSGWDVSTLDGEIEVAANSSATEGVLLYPALLTSGVTASSLFASFMKYESGVEHREGGTLSYVERAGPVATVTVHINGATLVGRASVLVRPLKTAVASEIGVVTIGWAPSGDYPGAAQTLAAIAACYQPERADLFEVFKSGPYTLVMPPGWKISQEAENYLELSGFNNAAGVIYELWGPFEKGVNSPVAITSTTSAISYLFSLYKIDVTRVLSTYTLPEQSTASGGVAAQEFMEFTATLNGKADHGLVYINTSIGGGVAAGVIRLSLASPALWNSVNGGLIEMMGSIQHNFSQDLQQIQAINQQWQDFSGQVANFDDVLNSQQLVQDPTTGTDYEAPYSSWDADGPDGAGYYLPNGQLLNPVQRS